ncbi:helix-turn-helix domain-containing protein [Falsiroseomonas sp. E2-1-a4]|uniref:helix-turn-helix domain-containing protein n=1 Tax=Falsiroseomonas sp. E2-1-a4 TaxID=3239299 RepID=UPI003F376392
MKRTPRHIDTGGAEAARVGEDLRDSRLSLGLSVEEMAQRLRIRRPYLEALEEGRIRDLPGPAYAVGFVRAYSVALGLDADEMVRRFRDLPGAGVNRKTDLIFPEPVPERGVPAGAVVVVGAILAIGAYVAWYNISGTGNRTVDLVPPVPQRLEAAAEQGRSQLPGRDAARPALPAVGALPLGALPPPGGLAQLPGGSPGGSNANTSAQAATVPSGTVPTGTMPPGTIPAAPQPVVPPAPIAAAPAPPPIPAAPPPITIPGLPDGTRVALRAKTDGPDGAWVQVRDQRSGQVLVNRVLRPGEFWAVPLRDNLLLDTGRAQGLEIVVDGALSEVLEDQVGVRRNIPLAPDRLRQRPEGPTAAALPQR